MPEDVLCTVRMGFFRSTVSNDNYEELVSRMDDYIAEFEAHGTDNILISDMDQP